ncbi:TPA: hypothetical protein PXS19_002522 [Yersinia enterocolitica]|nr:hypothetical protein [Yersinia enterocolitica]HDL8531904.1 hypothetical protein [Yersinia enterocolitica]HDL8551898.1 hypothetical protein [Yersinia enterocolitica]HDL8560584.1 hypothetical protein [Yersinia enterocolitica]
MLGNGFTIDLINAVGKSGEIDPSDLFKYGDVVKWPATGEPGFLSARYCPNLWRLGARPGLNRKDSYSIIEELITVINLYATLPLETVKKKNQSNLSPLSNIYIYAYQELVAYLRELFIYYDSKVTYEDLRQLTWGWSDYFTKLDKDPSIGSIDIITYNYDIYLERILDVLNIKFSIPGIKDGHEKFKIYKPHGSISFLYEGYMSKDNYNIQKELSLNNGDISKFKYRYDDLSLYMPLIPIIPPAGEAHRYAQNWANAIKKNITDAIKSYNPKDDFFICGISYWHVDRAEIDEIIRELNSEANVRMINPGNVDGLSAILGMVFDSYVHHSSSHILKELV